MSTPITTRCIDRPEAAPAAVIQRAFRNFVRRELRAQAWEPK